MSYQTSDFNEIARAMQNYRTVTVNGKRVEEVRCWSNGYHEDTLQVLYRDDQDRYRWYNVKSVTIE